MNELETGRRPHAGDGRGAQGGAAMAAAAAAHGASLDLGESAFGGAIRTAWHGAKQMIPDSAFIMLQHRRLIGRWPNLRRPTAYNESILLRSLHPDPRWVKLTDKLTVRDYVREKIGERHLIPLVAVPAEFTREVFDALPASFVMKANHGCSFVKIVRDKSTTSFEALRALANRWLSIDFSRYSRERHYRFIAPKLYFEQLLVDESGKIPADLKLHMFGGRPQGPRIQTMVIADRFGDARGDLYDEHWQRMDVRFGPYRPSDVPVARPKNWNEIERIAVRLAEDFDFVRVDLYSMGDEVYFGELTFTPGAGLMRFTPDSHDYDWGEMLRASAEGFERMRRAACLP
ncbi:MAG: ATP-grasp fold amidoligase family protein [Trinickia sp.]|uniref:ATP-grasp fold amidoligase family protein n=1 Tax=Trinickia sp. TaxID=2571163 RepID=UPI003F8172F5